MPIVSVQPLLSTWYLCCSQQSCCISWPFYLFIQGFIRAKDATDVYRDIFYIFRPLVNHRAKTRQSNNLVVSSFVSIRGNKYICNRCWCRYMVELMYDIMYMIHDYIHITCNFVNIFHSFFLANNAISRPILFAHFLVSKPLINNVFCH